MAAGVMATTAPGAPASVLERTTVMWPEPLSQPCTSPQVSQRLGTRIVPRLQLANAIAGIATGTQHHPRQVGQRQPVALEATRHTYCKYYLQYV